MKNRNYMTQFVFFARSKLVNLPKERPSVVMTEKAKKTVKGTTEKLRVGWREWAALPSLGIPAIKVKIDTGANTSALHAKDVEIFTRNRKKYVRFIVNPRQRDDKLAFKCVAPLVSRTRVRSSNGQMEERFTIMTPMVIGDRKWDIELTLTNRDIMNYRMLLGRKAMKDFIIDPAKSYRQGGYTPKDVDVIYKALAKFAR